MSTLLCTHRAEGFLSIHMVLNFPGFPDFPIPWANIRLPTSYEAGSSCLSTTYVPVALKSLLCDISCPASNWVFLLTNKIHPGSNFLDFCTLFLNSLCRHHLSDTRSARISLWCRTISWVVFVTISTDCTSKSFFLVYCPRTSLLVVGILFLFQKITLLGWCRQFSRRSICRWRITSLVPTAGSLWYLLP